MKTLLAIVVGFAAATATLCADKLTLVGGTAINPADGKTIENATIAIDGNTIRSVAPASSQPPAGAKTVDCKGKFILPGYIDTHIHFFQSADLFTRPDGADFNKIRPYAQEVAWVKSHVDDVLLRYLRCGITSVVDVGGPFWNFEVRKHANSTAKGPRGGRSGPVNFERFPAGARPWRSAHRQDRYAGPGS